MNFDFDIEFPRAHGARLGTAELKSLPEDFLVEEILGFEATGQGEHAFLLVEKRNANTDWVAAQLAKYAGVSSRDVGYAGLKDRHAITRQFFSVYLKKEAGPNWLALENAEFRILSATRHDRKLKRGALELNRFRILLRAIQFNEVLLTGLSRDSKSPQCHIELDSNLCGNDKSLGEEIILKPSIPEVKNVQDILHQRVEKIRKLGVPNYFGEQRFGHQGGNLERALAMFEGARFAPNQQSIYLSAARSWLFNQILARRVTEQNWNQALSGEVFGLDGSGSIFGPEPITDVLQTRLDLFDIHPTAAMWGQGELRSQAQCLDLESSIANQLTKYCNGLEKAGLRQERRATRVQPKELECVFDADLAQAKLTFTLESGSYATMVLRELFECTLSTPFVA